MPPARPAAPRPSPPPPRVVDELLPLLRRDLAESRFTVDGIESWLGPVANGALGRDQPVPARRAVSRELAGGTEAGQPDPLATLLGLFTLGIDMPAALVARALGHLGVDGARRLGLIETASAAPPDEPTAGDGDRSARDWLRATVDLRPHGDDSGHGWWVASDLGEMARPGPLPLDHVLGIGGASMTLASWTPRTPVDRALDLGTGCGIQALHLAGHAQRIVVTDLSERALAFAAFNAALAGGEWEPRTGSMLEPVAGERFDLIVSNPPFVITPRTPEVPRYEYRDGGRAGHAIAAELAAGVEEHLTPGGVAQFLANWEVREGETWQEVVEAWVSGTGVDAWVVQRDRQDPAEYAELWARDGGHRPGSAEHGALLTAWLEDFAARGVVEIGFGVVTLRRPATDRPPQREFVDAPGSVATPMGPSIATGLAAREWLAEHDDDQILERAWVVADDVTEERVGRPGSEPSVIAVRQGGGLGRAVRLDTLDAALLSVCDGDLTARSALVAIAALLEVEESAALAQGAQLIRRLAADGLLRSS